VNSKEQPALRDRRHGSPEMRAPTKMSGDTPTSIFIYRDFVESGYVIILLPMHDAWLLAICYPKRLPPLSSTTPVCTNIGLLARGNVKTICN
jgi:hypothetical protein